MTLTIPSHIQLAQPKHYAAIAEIYNESIRTNKATMYSQLFTDSDIANWVNNYDDRERLLVYLKEEAVIGWGNIKRYSEREGYRFAGITSVFFTES